MARRPWPAGCLGIAALVLLLSCGGMIGLGWWLASPGTQHPARQVVGPDDDWAILLRPAAGDPGMVQATALFMTAVGAVYEQAAWPPPTPRPWQLDDPGLQVARQPVALPDLDAAWTAWDQEWAVALNLPLYPRLIRWATRLGHLRSTEALHLDWVDETLLLASSGRGLETALGRLRAPSEGPNPLVELLDGVEARWDIALAAREGPTLTALVLGDEPVGNAAWRPVQATGGIDLVSGDVAEFELNLSLEAAAEDEPLDSLADLVPALCERLERGLEAWRMEPSCVGAVAPGELALTGRLTHLDRTWALLADMTLYGPDVRERVGAAGDDAEAGPAAPDEAP